MDLITYVIVSKQCAAVIAYLSLMITFVHVPESDASASSCLGTTWVLYMSSSFWLLGVESRDFSQTEKERTACKAEQSHKMTTIFPQNGNLGPF